MKGIIIIAFIVFSASMTKLYSQEIVFLPLNQPDTITDKEYLLNYYNKQGDSYYIVDTMLYSCPKYKINKSYSQEISIINLPLNSYDTIKKYYHIPYFKQTCDTIKYYHIPYLKQTCDTIKYYHIPYFKQTCDTIKYYHIPYLKKTCDTIADYAQILGGAVDNTFGAQKGFIELRTYNNGIQQTHQFIMNNAGTVFIGDSTDLATKIKSTHVEINSDSTIVNGSTSGNMVCKMPERGSGYKIIIIYCNKLNGTATYTLPTKFIHAGVQISNMLPPNVNSLSIGTTSISVDSTAAATGFIIIGGY